MTANPPSRQVRVTKRDEQPSHADIRNDINVLTLTLQKLQTTVANGFEKNNADIAAIKEVVGYAKTDEHGALIGVGIAGDLGRLRERVDRRFARYDAFQRYAMGAMAATTLLAAVLWWLLQEKLAEVLK